MPNGVCQQTKACLLPSFRLLADFGSMSAIAIYQQLADSRTSSFSSFGLQGSGLLYATSVY